MSFTVRLYREASKALDRIDRPTRERIMKRLRELEQAPLDKSKELKGVDDVRSSRVGDWRILYTVSEEQSVLHVWAVRSRGQAYRRLH